MNLEPSSSSRNLWPLNGMDAVYSQKYEFPYNQHIIVMVAFRGTSAYQQGFQALYI